MNPESRSHLLAATHRVWVTQRYPGIETREKMRDNLGVPDYRPKFHSGVDFSAVMPMFLLDVVERARTQAASVSLDFRGGRPVINALSGKAPTHRAPITAIKAR